jgi:hypothetical protein
LVEAGALGAHSFGEGAVGEAEGSRGSSVVQVEAADDEGIVDVQPVGVDAFVRDELARDDASDEVPPDGCSSSRIIGVVGVGVEVGGLACEGGIDNGLFGWGQGAQTESFQQRVVDVAMRDGHTVTVARWPDK